MTRSLPASALRELDQIATRKRGIPSLLLMENAGRAVSAMVVKKVSRKDGPIVVLVGPGNNGGDGLVVARTLFNRGFAVRVYFIGALEKIRELSTDTQTNARLWRDLAQPGAPKDAGRLIEVGTAADLASLNRDLGAASLVVDAMFGTGLTRALRSPWCEVVQALNTVRHKRQIPVIAVDVPSGLHADTGEVLGAAVHASSTVTFVAPKPGFFLGQGPESTGALTVAEIGIPRDMVVAALMAHQSNADV